MNMTEGKPHQISMHVTEGKKQQPAPFMQHIQVGCCLLSFYTASYLNSVFLSHGLLTS